MKKLIGFGLLSMTFALPMAFSSGSSSDLPGVELGAGESQSISGGQCFFYQVYCFQANNMCSTGVTYLASQAGSPGRPVNSQDGVCFNGMTGNYCGAGSGTTVCANP